MLWILNAEVVRAHDNLQVQIALLRPFTLLLALVGSTRMV